MEDLLRHILEPIAIEPERLRVECKEGESLLNVDLYLGQQDYDVVKEKYADAEYAIRHVLSIASGERKPYLMIYNLDQEEQAESTQEETEQQ